MKMLRFLLTYGHSIDIIDTVPNCHQIMDRWESGGLALSKEKRLSGVDQLSRRWSFLTDELVGILVQDPPKEIQDAVRQQSPAGIRWPQSGSN